MAKNPLDILRESRAPDGTIRDSIILNGDSYRWLADKVEEYSDRDSDYMALAASEFRKVAEALDLADEVLIDAQ